MNPDKEPEETSIRRMKRILFIVGGLFILAGVVRQWPVFGRTYREFIEGEGYLSLMLGLIVVVLGFSVRLLTGRDENS